MKKQSGFTLIELVIVIIILGILAATAVPKFVDLQGDARQAAMKGLKGALEGAATLTYSKAAIDGNEKVDSGTANGISIVYGYPAGTSSALSTAANLSTEDWTITASSGTAIIVSSNAASGANGTDESYQCRVQYIQAQNSAARPTINAQIKGC